MTASVDLVVKTIPLVGSISSQVDEDMTRALIATNTVTIASSAANGSARRGAVVYNSDNGTKSLGVGVIGASPQQLETAGVLKPGASKIIQRMLDRGITDTKRLLPAALFTGVHSVSSLKIIENTRYTQAAVAASTLKQSAALLTAIGAIQPQTPRALVAGAILSGATVGISQTVEALNSIVGTQISATSAAASIENNTPPHLGLAPSWAGVSSVIPVTPSNTNLIDAVGVVSSAMTNSSMPSHITATSLVGIRGAAL